MVVDELKYHILQSFGLPPTVEQARAVSVLCRFMADDGDRVAMILRGAAGTGKTTLSGAVVRALGGLGQRMVLLAPTGRAAKLMARRAGCAAFTIHRRIYRQRTAGDLSAFNLNVNLQRDTLFIVDEASMVSNGGGREMAVFGSGYLLDDLVQYVYAAGRNCRLLLVGDPAQLPPVGEAVSVALEAATWRGYGVTVYEAELSEVVRQSKESGILYNATMVRRMLTPPRIRLSGFADICIVSGSELVESLAASYGRVGMEETIVITRSNKRANIYNRGIRSTVLDRDEELCRGDRLMVVKNNYRASAQDATAAQALTFIANGDVAIVQRVRHVHELYGFRFAEAELQFPDYGEVELTTTVLLDTLTAESPALTSEQQLQLYERVMEDYAELPRKQERVERMRQDCHYNALQVKFAYAVTCHKAQGGQWAHVYVDQGYVADGMHTPDYQHWLYTAFTRATERLFLVDWPQSQLEGPPTNEY